MFKWSLSSCFWITVLPLIFLFAVIFYACLLNINLDCVLGCLLIKVYLLLHPAYVLGSEAPISSVCPIWNWLNNYASSLCKLHLSLSVIIDKIANSVVITWNIKKEYQEYLSSTACHVLVNHSTNLLLFSITLHIGSIANENKDLTVNHKAPLTNFHLYYFTSTLRACRLSLLYMLLLL